jgi:hypothetical protein
LAQGINGQFIANKNKCILCSRYSNINKFVIISSHFIVSGGLKEIADDMMIVLRSAP